MDKPTRSKSKSKKPTKVAKKRKSEAKDGPTCSMFLADLTRKFALKRRQEEETKNVVETIIDSITNALPLKIFTRSPSKTQSPIVIETLQNYAPELLPNDTIDIPHDAPIEGKDPVKSEEEYIFIDNEPQLEADSGIPRMPLIDLDVLSPAIKKRKIHVEDIAVNTGDHDVATEIAKHVGTLKKISLIAEEFNKKTAQNLKEIVDSVQGDLIKKLEEVQAEQKAAAVAAAAAAARREEHALQIAQEVPQ